jgi:hypothetical protein
MQMKRLKRRDCNNKRACKDSSTENLYLSSSRFLVETLAPLHDNLFAKNKFITAYKKAITQTRQRDEREVCATVRDEIFLLMKANVSWRWPPLTIQPFLYQLEILCSCCPDSVSHAFILDSQDCSYRQMQADKGGTEQ